MEDLNMTTEVLQGDVVDTETDLADVVDLVDDGIDTLHGDLSFLAKLIGFLAGLGAIGSLIASGFGIKKLIEWIKGKKETGKKSKKSKAKKTSKAKKVEEDDESDDDESEESEE